MSVTFVRSDGAEFTAERILLGGGIVPRLGASNEVILDAAVGGDVAAVRVSDDDTLQQQISTLHFSGTPLNISGGIATVSGAPQFTRVLYVDAGGMGDSTTIQGAIDAAVTAGAAVDNWYLVQIMAGVAWTSFSQYTETVHVYAGVHLRGHGKNTTYIEGQVTVHAGATIENIHINAPTAAADALILNMDAAYNVTVRGCYVRNFKSNDAVARGIRMTGTAMSPIGYVEDCYIYVRNALSGAFTVAACVLCEVDSTVTGAHMEVRCCHLKTSVPSNDAIPVTFAKVSATSGFDVGIMAGACEWEAWHTGISIAPRLLDSVNATSGAFAATMHVAITTPYGDLVMPTWNSSSANSRRHFPAQMFRSVEAMDGFYVGGVQIVTSLRALQNLTIPAALISSGTLATARGGTGADGSALAASLFLVSPTAGGAAAYRAMVAADVPTLTSAKISDFTTAARATISILDGTNIDLSYNSSTGVISASITGQVGLANGGTAVDNTSRTANTIFAGPTSGGAGSASFRTLVAADIPSITSTVVSDFTEAVQDVVGAYATDGTNIDVVYNDASNTLTFNITGVLARANLPSQIAYEDEANTFAGNQTFSGAIRATTIRQTTSDGSDTSLCEIAGGGDTNNGRGAVLQLAGNEHATIPGRLSVIAGATGYINLIGNVVPGTAALATSATTGFTYDLTCAGAPTGAPTAYTGRAPSVIDTTNGRAYWYYGGAWHYATLT